MSYNVSLLTTPAECDQLIQSANDYKEDLQFGEVSLTRRNNSRLRTATKLAATLATVVAQIDAFTAARAAMPEGPEKDSLSSKLRRLNDRMENLEESRSRAGAVSLLDTEMERSMIAAQIGVVDDYKAALQARKEALLAEEVDEEEEDDDEGE